MYTEPEKQRLAHDLVKWSDFELLAAQKQLTKQEKWDALTLVETEINRRLHVGLQNDTAA